MPLQLAITRTLPLYPNGTFIQWDAVGDMPAGSYRFDVYRSGSPDGPWDALATLTDAYNYFDRFLGNAPTTKKEPPNQLSLVRGLFYRVVITGSGHQAEAISAVEPQLRGRQKLLKRKLLRDLRVALRHFDGVEVAVCKRMHWGPRCATCFDKYTKQLTRTHDPACMGTGFVPGYFTPIVTWAQRSPSSPDTQMTPEGQSDTSLVMVTMLDAPAVQEDDILIFLRDNRRFLVKKMQPPEIQTVSIFQTLTASELARSAIEYRIPVDALRAPALF